MKKKSLLFDIVEVILATVIVTFLLIKFILIPCKVDGSSMFPTLMEDDFGYSFVVSRNMGLNRFDIVVIKTDEKLIVKRIIGMPNEKIEYIDNKLYINGEYMETDFLADDVYTNDFSYQIGDNQYFCLGDNRSVSKDSRFYGPFDESRIISSHIMVFFPFSNFGYKK